MHVSYQEGHGHCDQYICNGTAYKPELHIMKEICLITGETGIHMLVQHEYGCGTSSCTGIPILAL